MRLAQSKTHGFTLVELLVVIGIIALLISILLPSLARARQAASLVSCQANFRQVYNACLFYAQDNNGYLPYVGTAWDGSQFSIAYTLSRYVGKDLPGDADFKNWNGFNNTSVSPVLSCSEKVYSHHGSWGPGGGNTSHWVYTTQFHPRAFVNMQVVGGSVAMQQEYPQYKLARCKDSASKVMMWEGNQARMWGPVVPRNSMDELDSYQLYLGNHTFTDPPANGDMTRYNDVLASEDFPNVDPLSWSWPPANPIRYRHMGNTQTVVAFFDGHVESRRQRELRVRDFLISK